MRLTSGLTMLCCAAAALTAQEDRCKSYGLIGAGGPTTYKDRGDRCEGTFKQEVSGSVPLEVISFAAGINGIDLKKPHPAQLSWTLPPNAAELRIQARSLRREHYYRMDTRTTARRFNWATDVLRAENLTSKEIGLLAQARPAGWTKDDPYIPVRVGAASDFKPVVMAKQALSEIYVSLALLRQDGSEARQIQKGEPLNNEYYPSSQGIEIPLAIDSPGYYRLSLSATLKNGGTASKIIYFYHPGN